MQRSACKKWWWFKKHKQGDEYITGGHLRELGKAFPSSGLKDKNVVNGRYRWKRAVLWEEWKLFVQSVSVKLNEE